MFTGTLHFLKPRMYEAIMPPYLPAPRQLVLASGAAEVAGGVGVLVPGLERAARWWLLATLVAVFPANVHMAVNPGQIEGLPAIPRWLLWARLPIQGAFAALVVKATPLAESGAAPGDQSRCRTPDADRGAAERAAAGGVSGA